MMISQLNRKGLTTNSLTKPNHIIQYEGKDAGNEVTRAGQGNSEEHESRLNDDVQDDNNGEMRVVQARDENESAKKKTKQGPHSHLVRWDKFLPFKSMKVLLVENDDSTRHVVSALLRNCGYEVKAVDNGKQAWNVLEDLTADIDLVLSEVVVPCLSGVGLLSKIMSKKIFKDIPVIMMSAHDSRSVVFKCLSKGAVDFLVKPIRKNELKNLWQHVWRKHQISSGASGSESGIWIDKSRIGEDSDNNTGSNDEDDTKSIGLDFKSESDSGTQSSWTTRAVDIDSPQPISPQNQFGDSPDRTRAPSGHPNEEPFGNNWANETKRRTSVGHDNDLDKMFMGKDLRIGIGNTPSLPPENGGENILTEKYSKLNSKKDDEKQDLDLNNEHPHEEDTPAVVDLLGVSSDGSNPRVENSPNNIVEGFSKDILTNTEIPFFEVMLKRPRDAQDNGTSSHDRNVLRHSDLSAFSRYNSASTANQAPTGNVGSCSPVDNSSDGAKTESTPNINSDSNGTPPNQRSNGSSNNNDMGSTTNDAFTKQVSFVDKPTTKKQPLAHDGQPSLHPNIQGSSRSGSSNVVRATAEGTSSNHNVNKSASGSSHKLYGHKRGNAASNSRGKNSENGARKVSNVNGTGYRGRSEEDESRFAQREAALKRFRQKRQERCFEKKVRYQSRKKLAEQRPRIRGQFIRKGMHQNNGNDIDYKPDPTTQ